MSQHNSKLHPVPSLALAPVEVARERSAVAVRSALSACPAGVVAHRLHCSEDLVRRWGRGQGSPSLAQILGAPERFALRLLAAAGEVYVPPSTVCEVPPRERLWLLAAALGALIAATPHGVTSLEQFDDQELAERDRQLADIEEHARRERAAIARVREAKRRGEVPCER